MTAGRRLRAGIGKLALAEVGFLLPATAILQGQSLRGYDAGTHLFLADHYLHSWWVTWEPRWYGGFDMVSYPPLAHQLLALAGAVIGLHAAVEMLSLVLVLTFPLVVRQFARVFVPAGAAWMAAACSLLFPAFALILIADGQIPGVLSLELLLIAFSAGARFLKSPSVSTYLPFVAGIAAAAAAHHATPVLIGPWLFLAVAWQALASGTLSRETGPGPALTERAWAKGLTRAITSSRISGVLLTAYARLAALVVGGIAAEAVVIWPFWRWWLARPPQAAIDHLSRHSVLIDAAARFINLWLPYSFWLIALPAAVAIAFRRRQMAGLAIAAVVCFILSLGGTTPLPRLIYGQQWEWLTYERFGLWTEVLLLPPLGVLLVGVLTRLPAILRNLGAILVLTVVSSQVIYAGWFSNINTNEPKWVDPHPIADFLAAPERQSWRYLTLGFGDELGEISALTRAQSADGNYNTARSDPTLTHSGVDKLDSIRHWDPTARALDNVLSHPEARSLRWVFANERYYDSLLKSDGWRPAALLSNGVVVWEPAITPPEIAKQPSSRVTASSAWWGFVPLFALVLCLWSNARLWGLRLAWNHGGKRADEETVFLRA